MKELSIEEKAKAYDEAKARMSRAWNDNRCTLGFMNEIFPELKESEEEKTKRILHSISNKISFHLCDIFTEEEFQYFDTWSNSWLEKQGEQNDSDFKDYNSIDPHFGKPIDKIEPNFNFKAGQWIVATGKCVYYITKIDGFNVTLVDVDGNEYVFDTSSLEDAHLLTIDDVKGGCKLGAKWQKKHDVSEDWGEEDEKMCQETIDWFEKKCFPYTLENDNPARESIKWLKSLKQRIGG